MQNSTANLTSATGTTEWTYSYEPYGLSHTTTQNDPSAPDNPIQYTGEYNAAATWSAAWPGDRG